MLPQLVLPALLAIVLAFVLSAAEAATFRMTPVRAQELLDEGRAGATSLVRVVADPSEYLAVLAFLRVAAESTTAVLVTMAVASANGETGRTLAIAVAIMAVVSFVIVGVSPRTLGRQNFESVALLSAPVTLGLRRVLGPVAKVLVALGNAVTPGRGYADGPFQSESELRSLVDMAGETDVIEDDEREMIHSVFELGDTIAREVMVPRTDLVTIDADRSLRKAMRLFIRSGFSRIPVVGDDGADDVLGLLYLKDVVERLEAAEHDAKLPVTELMRPAHFVPDSKPIDGLLREMQRDATQFAVVVDEYGGTAGVVTMEDIVEEIVGEITDEYDRDAPEVEQLDARRSRVPAQMDVDDLAELFDVQIDEDDVDTVGGLLAKAIGRVPIAGSHAVVEGLSLTAERMSGRRHRVATIIVERLPEADDDEPTPEHDARVRQNA